MSTYEVRIYNEDKLLKSASFEPFKNKIYRYVWKEIPQGDYYRFEVIEKDTVYQVDLQDKQFHYRVNNGKLTDRNVEPVYIDWNQGLQIEFNTMSRKITLKKAWLTKILVNLKDYGLNNIETVYLAGSFNGWKNDITIMEKIDDSIYQKYMVLEEGEYEYKIYCSQLQEWFPSGESLKLIVGEKSNLYPSADLNSATFIEEALKHDPYNLQYLNNINNKEFEITLRVQKNDAKKIELIFNDGEIEYIVDMKKSYDPYFGFMYFRCIVSANKTIVRFKYYFKMYDNKGSAFYTPKGLVNGQPSYFNINYEVDSNLPIFNVPQWSRYAIWYSIMPDRFYKGNFNNMPLFNEFGPNIFKKDKNITQLPDFIWSENGEIKFTPSRWATDIEYRQLWEDQIEYKQYSKHFRKYGGDLRGIKEKIPYLKELGINAVYLTPVFWAYSHNKYDPIDLRHICPDLGTNKLTGSLYNVNISSDNPYGNKSYMDVLKGDFKGKEEQDLLRIRLTGANKGKNGYLETEDPSTWVWSESDLIMVDLIKEFHKNEIRVIFDLVYNHCSINNWIIDVMLLEGETSPYKDWFKLKTFGDYKKVAKVEDENEAYKILKYNKDTIVYEGLVKGVPEYNTYNKNLKEYFINTAKKWMLGPDGTISEDLKDCDGVDGFRLDAPMAIDIENEFFWEEWRQEIKKVNKDTYIVQEIWTEAKKDMNRGKKFDAVMNYEWLKTVINFFINIGKEKGKVTYKLKASEFLQHLQVKRFCYPIQVNQASFNLTGSHDTDRLISRVINDRLGRVLGKVESLEQGYNTIRPDLAETNDRHTSLNWREMKVKPVVIVKLIYVFQMTYIGAPLIYYGDEVGMWGATDPYCRKPMLWDECQYEDETDGTIKGKKEKYSVKPDIDLFQHVKKLISIRKESNCFATGGFEEVLTNDEKDLLAYKRYNEEDEYIIIINNSWNQYKNLQIYIGETQNNYKEILHNRDFLDDGKGSITIDINRKDAVILKKTNK